MVSHIRLRLLAIGAVAILVLAMAIVAIAHYEQPKSSSAAPSWLIDACGPSVVLAPDQTRVQNSDQEVIVVFTDDKGFETPEGFTSLKDASDYSPPNIDGWAIIVVGTCSMQYLETPFSI